jgi:phosphoribosylformylglycinamidine synthase subunit PurQ / glutaminase
VNARIGVVTFPGSLDDGDAARAVRLAGGEAVRLWHGDADLHGVDAVVLPGGFAYGDYLRCGAMAAHSPVMRDVVARAKTGTPVLGICNGFQVLLEAGLLPGAMLRNRSLKFRCEFLHVKVEQTDTPFTQACRTGQLLKVPIAHGDGNYYAEPDVIARLERNRQVIFRYVSAAGDVAIEANPNGSVNNIAGICNESRNVVGLMPHPERACELAVGSADGRAVFESILNWSRVPRVQNTLTAMASGHPAVLSR